MKNLLKISLFLLLINFCCYGSENQHKTNQTDEATEKIIIDSLETLTLKKVADIFIENINEVTNSPSPTPKIYDQIHNILTFIEYYHPLQSKFEDLVKPTINNLKIKLLDIVTSQVILAKNPFYAGEYISKNIKNEILNFYDTYRNTYDDKPLEGLLKTIDYKKKIEYSRNETIQNLIKILPGCKDLNNLNHYNDSIKYTLDTKIKKILNNLPKNLQNDYQYNIEQMNIKELTDLYMKLQVLEEIDELPSTSQTLQTNISQDNINNAVASNRFNMTLINNLINQSEINDRQLEFKKKEALKRDIISLLNEYRVLFSQQEYNSYMEFINKPKEETTIYEINGTLRRIELKLSKEYPDYWDPNSSAEFN